MTDNTNPKTAFVEVYNPKTGQNYVTLAIYTINHDYENISYREERFSSFSTLQRFLHHAGALKVNHCYWATPWRTRCAGEDLEIRDIYQALDFDYYGDFVAFGITVEDRQALLSHGWGC